MRSRISPGTRDSEVEADVQVHLVADQHRHVGPRRRIAAQVEPLVRGGDASAVPVVVEAAPEADGERLAGGRRQARGQRPETGRRGAAASAKRYRPPGLPPPSARTRAGSPFRTPVPGTPEGSRSAGSSRGRGRRQSSRRMRRVRTSRSPSSSRTRGPIGHLQGREQGADPDLHRDPGDAVHGRATTGQSRWDRVTPASPPSPAASRTRQPRPPGRAVPPEHPPATGACACAYASTITGSHYPLRVDGAPPGLAQSSDARDHGDRRARRRPAAVWRRGPSSRG